jgi:hypothetical protein
MAMFSTVFQGKTEKQEEGWVEGTPQMMIEKERKGGMVDSTAKGLNKPVNEMQLDREKQKQSAVYRMFMLSKTPTVERTDGTVP